MTETTMKRRLKTLIFHHSLKHPWLYSIARSAKFYYWRLRVTLSRQVGAAYDPDKLLQVSPCDIALYIGGEAGNRFTSRGTVKGGDWDLGARPFEEWDVYKSIRQHFIEGIPWESTPYYLRMAKQIQSGQTIRGISDVADLSVNFKAVDKLYEDIRIRGFASSGALPDGRNWEPASAFTKHDDVTVSINRHGRLMLHDGKHRLSIAKLLQLKQIPVAVAARHSDWHAFRSELLDYAAGRNGYSYQPFTHPDLQDIPVQHNSHREVMIERHMPVDARSVLDIGAYLGFFCLHFSKKGYRCTAVEHHPRHAYFMRKLMVAEGVDFEIVENSFLDWLGSRNFDVMLALNIFHHFLKTKELKEALDRRLREIKAQCIFLETHCQDDEIMKGAYANFAPQEFAEYVRAGAGLAKVEALGQTSRGRQMFKIFN